MADAAAGGDERMKGTPAHGGTDVRRLASKLFDGPSTRKVAVRPAEASASGPADQNLPESLQHASNGLAALGTASSRSDDGFARVEIARETPGKQ